MAGKDGSHAAALDKRAIRTFGKRNGGAVRLERDKTARIAKKEAGSTAVNQSRSSRGKGIANTKKMGRRLARRRGEVGAVEHARAESRGVDDKAAVRENIGNINMSDIETGPWRAALHTSYSNKI